MTFYDRFELAQEALSVSIRDSITNHHNGFFDMWLDSNDAASAFGYAYQNIFKEHFGDYITEEIKAQLWFAGKNIVYAIKSFMILKNNEYSLEELLEFVETFLSEQLNDFENDYECSFWFNSDSEEQNRDDPV